MESAVGNVILGAAPLVSNKFDGFVQPLLGRFDNVRLLPTRAGLPTTNALKRRGFTDEIIEMIEYRGATGPGTGASKHSGLSDIRPEDGWAKPNSLYRAGIDKQNENFLILRDLYGYNIVNEPNKAQLAYVQYDKRTNAFGRPIKSADRMPDYIIEGRVFDAYTVGSPDNILSSDVALDSIWYTLTDKVPGQTDRLVIDLSYTDLTPDEVTEFLSHWYTEGDSILAELKEVFLMKDNDLADLWIQPNV